MKITRPARNRKSEDTIDPAAQCPAMTVKMPGYLFVVLFTAHIVKSPFGHFASRYPFIFRVSPLFKAKKGQSQANLGPVKEK